jgi:hypothetical protein
MNGSLILSFRKSCSPSVHRAVATRSQSRIHGMDRSRILSFRKSCSCPYQAGRTGGDRWPDANWRRERINTSAPPVLPTASTMPTRSRFDRRRATWCPPSWRVRRGGARRALCSLVLVAYDSVGCRCRGCAPLDPLILEILSLIFSRKRQALQKPVVQLPVLLTTGVK